MAKHAGVDALAPTGSWSWLQVRAAPFRTSWNLSADGAAVDDRDGQRSTAYPPDLANRACCSGQAATIADPGECRLSATPGGTPGEGAPVNGSQGCDGHDQETPAGTGPLTPRRT